MAEWWARIGLYNQILFIVALATTAFMIFQIITLLVGFASDNSFDGDVSSGDLDGASDGVNDGGAFEFFGLKLLNLRTITAFLCIFSWATYTFNFIVEPHVWLATILGVIAGLAAAVGVAAIMKSFLKLQASGTIEIGSCVGKTGDVYLTIPANKNGAGKVNVNLTARVVEYDAMTASTVPLPTGSAIRVIGVVGNSVLLVEKL